MVGDRGLRGGGRGVRSGTEMSVEEEEEEEERESEKEGEESGELEEVVEEKEEKLKGELGVVCEVVSREEPVEQPGDTGTSTYSILHTAKPGSKGSIRTNFVGGGPNSNLEGHWSLSLAVCLGPLLKCNTRGFWSSTIRHGPR